ncbi:MAG: hypothetical protein WA139_03470 [Candidatus Aenigmatarchaeota archaeon]
MPCSAVSFAAVIALNSYNGETGVDCGGGGCADCAVTPPPTCTSCSDSTLVGACNSAGQRCSLVDNVCSLWTDSSCTGGTTTDNCPAQATKSLCDFQTGTSSSYACSWCPNSYSGATTANGGTCMKAENLAGSCG